MEKPEIRPVNNYFSSGPCKKRPGWSIKVLEGAILGRSHRTEPAFSRLKQAIESSRKLLALPDDYLIGIVPGSDTGAMEMAMWSTLGARGVDMLVWESFSRDWLLDVVQELRLKDVRTIEADYGMLPDLDEVDFSRDVVFVWNGTTSGVKVPDGNWIADDRNGLTICDATSAVFAMELPWHKLDVITYSWQKALGGEAAHGMLILSPRAVERIESYRPPWPVPKLFRLTKNGKLKKEIFNGMTINTPSMLCVEDYLDAIHWAESMGGLKSLIEMSNRNFSLIEDWVEKTGWVDFLCREKEYRSNSSVCLKIITGEFNSLARKSQNDFILQMITLLEKEKIAYDIKGYRSAPPGLRIWAGATVESGDIEALLPWLDWAYYHTRDDFKY